jgi:hypothetical protein
MERFCHFSANILTYHHDVLSIAFERGDLTLRKIRVKAGISPG